MIVHDSAHLLTCLLEVCPSSTSTDLENNLEKRFGLLRRPSTSLQLCIMAECFTLALFSNSCNTLLVSWYTYLCSKRHAEHPRLL